VTTATEITLPEPWAGTQHAAPIPGDLGTVERALVAHLKALAKEYGGPLAQIAIEHFPDRPETYRLVAQAGAVLVRFDASRFEPQSESVDIVTQSRTLVWDFNVIARDLGWAYGGQKSGISPGAYSLLEALRHALCGLVVPGFTRMTAVEESFAGRDESGGVWFYSAKYAHRGLVVEHTPDVVYPTWLRTTWLERGGQTAEPVSGAAYTFDAGGVVQLPARNVTVSAVVDAVSGVAYAPPDYRVDAVAGTLIAASTGPLGPGSAVLVWYEAADYRVFEQ